MKMDHQIWRLSPFNEDTASDNWTSVDVNQRIKTVYLTYQTGITLIIRSLYSENRWGM